MATISEIASKLRSEIYSVLDGQFFMSDGTKVTYNPCKDPRYPGCFYCSIIEPNGFKKPTIIVDPKTGRQVA
jgi:hypothetical protein